MAARSRSRSRSGRGDGGAVAVARVLDACVADAEVLASVIRQMKAKAAEDPHFARCIIECEPKAEVVVDFQLMSGTVKETACPTAWSAAQLLQHAKEVLAPPDTDVVLRHAGAVVDAGSGSVLTLAGDAERLDLQAVLQWRFADAAAADPDSALIEAAWRGHAQSVERLIALRADTGAVATSALCDRLIENAALPQDQYAFEGPAALDFAACAGNAEAIVVLLAAGVHPGARADGGVAPLHIASKYGHRAATEVLLAHGAAVSPADHFDSTPLHNAAVSSRGDHAGVVEVLLAHRAAVNATEVDDSTPLHHVAGGQHADLIEVLLAHGAAVNAGDEFGNTPLHVAARAGHAGAAEVLLAHGAAADAADVDGETPLDFAMQRRHRAVADVLHRALRRARAAP